MLFLTYAYPPSRRPRAIQISRLVEQLTDEDITVIAGDDFLYPDAVPVPSHAKVLRVEPSWVTNFIEKCKGDRFKRALLPDLHYFWSKDLYYLTRKHIASHDRLVTFGMPMSVHNAGYKLKKEFPHLKWIAHFSDPWVDNHFTKMNSWLRWINQKNQDNVFQAADKLIFTSKETLRVCTAQYNEDVQQKAYYLPHSFDERLFPSPTQHDNKKFIIRHIGALYGRNLNNLVQAIGILKDENRYPDNTFIEFIGAEEHQQHESSVIKFLPSIPYRKSLETMVNANLLLAIDVHAGIKFSLVFLSKLADYMGANKPIFGICPPGTSCDVIKSLGGFVAHPQDPRDIAEKLLLAINEAKKTPFIAHQNEREKYRSTQVSKEFLKILSF